MDRRAGIVVTGTEVLIGLVSDRNGPWLAEQLRLVGVDVAQIIVVGDRPADLRNSVRFLADAGVDLIITSGGLGPTADDLTADVVADVQGRPLRLDADLETRITGIVERLTASRGWRLNPDATARATRKQALVPDGASVLAPVGTAPGLVVPVADGRPGPPVVVLPGPPWELQAMWPEALRDPVVAAALAGRGPLQQRMMRLWGIPESELAATLRGSASQLSGLEITTCLRGGELEIVTRYRDAAGSTYAKLEAAISAAYPDALFSPDGHTIDEIVADGLRSQNLTIGTAESCTGGLLAARLTDQPGSSAYVLGGLVVYSNAAKEQLAGVPDELISRVGAVSAEVAEALATGARARLSADIGVGITGVAGPSGGSAEKPVGLVYLCANREGGSATRRISVPGSRSDVRSRAVVTAMHMIRELVVASNARGAPS
jgi:nicotinamide-nucleotide amidase